MTATGQFNMPLTQRRPARLTHHRAHKQWTCVHRTARSRPGAPSALHDDKPAKSLESVRFASWWFGPSCKAMVKGQTGGRAPATRPRTSTGARRSASYTPIQLGGKPADGRSLGPRATTSGQMGAVSRCSAMQPHTHHSCGLTTHPLPLLSTLADLFRHQMIKLRTCS